MWWDKDGKYVRMQITAPIWALLIAAAIVTLAVFISAVDLIP